MVEPRAHRQPGEYRDRSVPAHIRYGSAEVEDLLTRRWSPVVMRWFLACRIIDARKAKGVGQPAVAKALDGWGLSKVGYIERAERTIETADDLEQLVVFYGIEGDDADLWRRLWELSHVQEWWDEHITSGDPRRDLEIKGRIGTEWGAHRMWLWLPAVVPVWVQTNEYTRSILDQEDPTRPARSRIMWEDVGNRRRHLLDGPDAARAEMLIDESALYRQVGGPDVLDEQLQHLRAVVTDWPNVRLRVMPYSAGYPRYLSAGFTSIALSPDADFPDVVHTEPTPSAEARALRGSAVEHYERVFNELSRQALDRDETLDALDRARTLLHAFERGGRVEGIK